MSNTESTWLKLAEDSTGLTFRKEVLPVGDWEKEGEYKFSITEESAQLIVDETNRMLKNGTKSPLLLTHDGQEPFGQAVRYEIGDSLFHKGKKSIFMVTKFATPELRDRGLRNDVSVFIPPSHLDAAGNQYKRPIRHVALTPTPVMPGLGEWEAIAASFTAPTSTPAEDPVAMDLTPIFDALQIDAPEGDEQAQIDAIVAAILELQGTGTEDPPADGSVVETGIAASFSPILLDGMIDGRKSQIDALTLGNSPKIDTATRDRLVAKYCDKESLTLSLSSNASYDDGFKDTLELLKNNAPTPPSGRESIVLSHNNEKAESPLVASAKKLAAAAKR